MAFIICLAHFCEQHGPTPIQCIQTVPLDFKLHPEPHPSRDSLCASCRFIPTNEGNGGRLVTTDSNSKIRFVSSQNPPNQSRFSAVRQACVRSLSVEHQVPLAQPLLFGDPSIGYTLSLTFKLADKAARGGERTYSILCISESESQLIHNWNRIVSKFTALVKSLKQSLNLNLNLSSSGSGSGNGANRGIEEKDDLFRHDTFLRKRDVISTPKSLVTLLGDDKVFIKIHAWGAYLIRELELNEG